MTITAITTSNPSSRSFEQDDIVLITGGAGFIGSHLAKRLHNVARVRIVDIKNPLHDQYHEFMQLDLRVKNNVITAMHGVSRIYHLAANMGGMGFIHAGNDHTIYRDNHIMTMNIIEVAKTVKSVTSLFYASSACVYPEELQQVNSADQSGRSCQMKNRPEQTITYRLTESVVWENKPSPQHLYGAEKLNSEILLMGASQTAQFQIQIARFHNVYGPHGTWCDGREKAPAALMRKAIISALLKEGTLEVWGSGQQIRSYLYIDDAIDAIIRFSTSDIKGPLNIGSEEAINSSDLAQLALNICGVPETRIHHKDGMPTGVLARTSDNTLIKHLLSWSPKIDLATGMSYLHDWMKKEILDQAEGRGAKQEAYLRELKVSRLVSASGPKFGLIVPVTSRGTQLPGVCLENLERLAESLARTTIHDTIMSGYSLHVYICIDNDDSFFEEPSHDPTVVFTRKGIVATVISMNHPRGHVCKIWREAAAIVFDDHADYIVLLGDDVVLESSGWMEQCDQAFQKLAAETNTPQGFGCIAFTDLSFPGMPTFPVLGATHYAIFPEIFPDVFINQGADPYLFQLYRRWNAARMVTGMKLRNTIGGSDEARYTKVTVECGTAMMHSASKRIEEFLAMECGHRHPLLTLDVIIPSYRVQLPYLDRILGLRSHASCSTMFIIIVDNPNAEGLDELKTKYEYDPLIRIRTNTVNLGASETRNRGLAESSGDYILFLDDDVVPSEALLKEAENVIRAYPSHIGFIGLSQFPPTMNIYTNAIHLAGVSFFWDIASRMIEDIPWGVTANLLIKRTEDDVKFLPCFPKTGGGEDIDFCLQKQLALGKTSDRSLIREFRGAPRMRITHPWWNDGKRSYSRFYNWAVGDGALIKLYPQHTYVDYTPNSAELHVLCCTMLCLATIGWILGYIGSKGVLISAVSSVLISVANLIAMLLEVFYIADELDTKVTCRGGRLALCCVESALIRMYSELGRTIGIIKRKEWGSIGRRFDWFVGRYDDGPSKNERRMSLRRCTIWIALVAVSVKLLI